MMAQTTLKYFLFFFSFFFFLSLLSASSSSSNLHDTITPPATIFPANPTSAPPANPDSTPVAIPITNTVTEPGPGTVPVSNPVTSYPPAPQGNIPVVAPPAVTNGPAVTGRSWCVARSGVQEAALQGALDYACGTGGADCSQIQPGGDCYNPNTLENHASFAFNTYYQKNPMPTSCDFGGAATVVSTDPSTGSCIYSSQSSSSSSAPPAPSTQTSATPVTSTPPMNPALSGSVTPPPLIFNPTNPASGTTAIYGSADIPPNADTSTTSVSSRLKAFIGCLAVVTSLVTGIIAL